MDLHEEKKEILRSEILSLLIKINIPFPQEKNFESLRRYFFKLIPLDDLSKKPGDVRKVPFYDKYFVHPNSPINNLYKILYKLQRKDLLHLIANKVLDSYTRNNSIDTLTPFINFDENFEEGVIDWKKIVFLIYNTQNRPQDIIQKEIAQKFLMKTFLYGSDILKEHLNEQLRLIITMQMNVFAKS